MSIISDFKFLRYYHAHLSDTPQVVSIFFMFTISHVLSLELSPTPRSLVLASGLDVWLRFK